MAEPKLKSVNTKLNVGAQSFGYSMQVAGQTLSTADEVGQQAVRLLFETMPYDRKETVQLEAYVNSLIEIFQAHNNTSHDDGNQQ